MNLTQIRAAENLGTTQPRLNDVLNGRIEKCTVNRLVNMLASVGYKVNLKTSHAAWLMSIETKGEKN